MLAAMLSAVTALLLAPGKGLTVTESLGPDLLMRALAAAVLARMTSLPKAFAAGIALGVIEKVGLWNWSVGQVELILFVVILGAMLLQARGGTRSDEASSWSFGQLVRPVPRALQGLRIVRSMNWTMAIVLSAIAAALPLFLSNSQTFLLTTVVAFAIVGLSVTVLTGYGGQISLGQIAFFGIGAATSYQLTFELYVPFWLSLLLSGLAGALASMVVGIPALRIRGLFLAITTLGFALVSQKWLLAQTWMSGSGVIATRPYIGPLDFAGQKAYYELALGGLLFAAWITRNVLRSGVGRNLLAVRDNEGHGAAFTVPVMRTKLYAFGISGFLAAFGGAIYGHGIERFQVNNFPVADSLRVVSMTIVGGLGSIPGTILGAFFVIGVDRLIDVGYLRLLTTSIGLLALLLYLPGGFGQVLYATRDRLLTWVAKRQGISVTVPEVEPEPEAVPA
jgi:ABC-type branched-subunit amino acid transport system permease subunit